MKPSRKFFYNGQERGLKEICSLAQVDYSNVCKKLKRGLSLEDSLKKSHGHTSKGGPSKVYRVWLSMRFRCSARCSDPAYKSVTLCKRWGKFENFLADMGEPPSDAHQLDRIDSRKGYLLSNCRWATPKENSQNRKNTVWLKRGGRVLCASDWAKEIGISPQAFFYRLKNKQWEKLNGGKFSAVKNS